MGGRQHRQIGLQQRLEGGVALAQRGERVGQSRGRSAAGGDHALAFGGVTARQARLWLRRARRLRQAAGAHVLGLFLDRLHQAVQ